MPSNHSDTNDSGQLTPPTAEEIYLVEKLIFVIEKINALKPLSTIAAADDATKERFHAWLTHGGGEKYKAKLTQFSETLTATLDSLEVKLVSSGKVLYQRALSAFDYNEEALETFFVRFPEILDFFYIAFSDPKAIFEEANTAFKNHQKHDRPDDTLLVTYNKSRQLDDKKTQEEKTNHAPVVVDIAAVNESLLKWAAAQPKTSSAPPPAKKAEKILMMTPSSHPAFDTKKILKELAGEDYLAMMQNLSLTLDKTGKVIPHKVEDLVQSLDKPLDIPEVPASNPFVQADELTNDDIISQLLASRAKNGF